MVYYADSPVTHTHTAAAQLTKGSSSTLRFTAETNYRDLQKLPASEIS